MKEILVIFAIFGGALAHHKVHLIPAHIICPDVTDDHDILIPSPLDCAVYYRCQNGMAVPENCPPGLEWCQVLSKCTLPVIANCTIGHNPVTYAPGETIPDQNTPSPSPNNVCPINGVFLPDPSDCRKYYECIDEIPKSQTCPDNQQYSCWVQQCVDTSDAICFDSTNQTGVNCPLEEVKLPNKEDCTSYYQCVNGQAVLKYCAEGNGYDAWFDDCVSMNNANCDIFVITTESITLSTPTSTISYNSCPIDGFTLPDILDCTRYYECVNDVPVSLSCPDNQGYSCWVQECVSLQDANCLNAGTNQTGASCISDGAKLSNPEDCGSYYQCEKGVVVLEECPEDEAFNEWLGKCTMDLRPCDVYPHTPPTATPTPLPEDNCPIAGATLPDIFDCTNYYKCVDDVPVSLSCPDNQGYSCWMQECVSLQDANCLNAGTDQPGANCSSEGTKLPNPEDCGSYYQCEEGQVVQEKCPDGEGFNAWVGACTLDLNRCDVYANASRPTTTTESTVTTHTSPTATPTPTPTPSGEDNCPIADATLPDIFDCTKYYKCVDDVPVSLSCPDNQGYSCWMQECVSLQDANCLNAGTDQPGANCSSDGTKLPNPEDCGSYYQCEEGQVVQEKCPDGEGFNAWVGNCTSDLTRCDVYGNASKPFTQPAVPTNSSHIPSSSVTTPTNPVHESTSTSTVTPSETTHKTSGTPTGSTESSATTSTSKSPNTPVTYSTTAPPETTTIPLPSIQEDVCPTDDVKMPNPVVCSSYYVCRNGTPEPEDCPEGQEYSCWDQECEVPLKATCIKQGSQQGSTCSNEDEFLPNLADCNSYYKCVNKSIELMYCPGDTYYNQWFQKCYEFGLAWCKTYPVITPPSTILPPIATIPPSTSEIVCPIEGATLPNILDCTSYYVCQGIYPVSVQCPAGEAYSCWDQICLPTDIAQCITLETSPGDKCSIDELKLLNIRSCNSYFECHDGKIEEKQCLEGLEYNSWFQKCVDKNTSHCTVSTTSTGITPTIVPTVTPTPGKDSCPINDQLLADPSDCSKYYICEDHQAVSKQCPTGESFNTWSKKCETSGSQNGDCISDINAGQNCSASTEMIPNVLDCGSYYVCVDGKVELQLCASGSFYNKWFQMCVSLSVAFCFSLNTPTLPTVPTLPSGNDDCPVNGVLIPNEIDCSTYYECIAFTPVLQSCQPGYAYSCWDQQCENSTEADCVTGVSSGRKCSNNGLKVPDATDCSSYYVCEDGEVKKQQCSLGMQFNKNFKMCVIPEYAYCQTYTTISAQPTPPVTLSPGTDVCPNEGALLPNPIDCSTYYKCQNGTPIIQHCADGLQYSCWEMQCMNPNDANCINERNQTGQPCTGNGQKSQNPEDCHLYYECQHGIVVSKKCPMNWYYNKWFKICVPSASLAHCKKPVTISPATPATTISPILSKDVCPIEGATLPNPTSCNHYYECQNESAVDKKCPSGQIYSCWDQKCLPKNEGKCITLGITLGDTCQREGETLQNVDSCSSYYQCVNGKVQQINCLPAYYYNKWFGRCMLMGYDHCETYTTTEQPTTSTEPVTIHTSEVCSVKNATIPNPKDCHSYYVCNGEYATLRHCPKEYNYDCVSQSCTLAIFTRCVDAPSAYVGQSCSKEGETIPDATDCKKYYKCSKGVIVNESCSFFKSYSVWSGKCELTGIAVCITSKIFDAIF